MMRPRARPVTLVSVTHAMESEGACLANGETRDVQRMRRDAE